MRLTDIFIKRPVLAMVVSLLILVLGLRSAGLLPILQYPFTENAVVTISTAYIGANADLVAGFITTPLENSIAQAEGIDYMTSTSTLGASTISANLRLNYNPGLAIADITTKVNAVLNQLPTNSQQPVITVAVGETIDSMYIGFYSHVLASNQITDYLIRIVQPKLQAVPGVQVAEILGERQYALRVWLDPMKLAGYGLTPADIYSQLSKNDFIAAVGRTKGNMLTIDLTASTGLTAVDEFRRVVIKSQNGAIVRLRDLAKVTLGAQNYNSSVQFDGESAVYIGIKVAPSANLLTVVSGIQAMMPSIAQQLPEGLSAKIVYDATEYVNSSIREVAMSLIEALVIVTVVIFLFLGSIRSVIVPVIAMPLSLIGAFFIMLVCHFSINLLTLLALVLAIGLVVDDAIIVVENIHRHLEAGTERVSAALKGAYELANPILAITVVLIAVYLPIGFMGGLTGALFTEFAFTLAGAVTISAVIALTLSPMMCSKLLRPTNEVRRSRFSEWVDHQFDRLQKSYHYFLTRALNFLPVLAVFAGIILVSNYFLFITSQSELAPQEDQGIILTQLTAAPNATLRQTALYSQQLNDVFFQFPETDHTFTVDGYNGLNTSISGMVLKPWDERTMTTNRLQPIVQEAVNKIAGAKIVAFQNPSLPGGGTGLPIQFVIQSTGSFNDLNEVAQRLMKKARATGLFMYLDSDLKIDKKQVAIKLDRDKAALLGLTMQDIGNVLSAALSENYVNYFAYDGRSYQVIPQVKQMDRQNADQILNTYIRSASGISVPLATVASLQTSVVPESINHFQQQNSATISAIALPSVTMGDALATFSSIAKEILPTDYTTDTAAQSRQYTKESSALAVTFLFSLIIIYLCLAALFESFRDPLIVLISVPMSICGAMIFISMGLGGATLNIYTEVGLVTLIGLISKHGILIVQFANDLQLEGKSKREAIEMSASIRLRPILMTTAAMVLGVVPLLRATGAGALSRFDIGLVIASGISIGTLFTLFVVPAMYLLLADNL
ncbi:MAG: multidrug efflux protein [Gammaproteobacteria bacterium RIFCSPHIGHO2_12_FULL_42_10]|nr:MAG: multidrug efflux protein [Gammaproteobacteria bacterium RIFCSPHIGHO2_12_FULL_42_10]